ncbi:hypothetical protein M153_5940003404 [Pseudoloma neurophilia]|uniref:Uncharacterized protein n=1 Tax=Pseudoloma neurophilia TaxID=146866 RepID=A0A0R0LWL0_9MICR|nr:hypothetical protein M153_5940003404 [Pseudoloma neurophilia]
MLTESQVNEKLAEGNDQTLSLLFQKGFRVAHLRLNFINEPFRSLLKRYRPEFLENGTPDPKNFPLNMSIKWLQIINQHLLNDLRTLNKDYPMTCRKILYSLLPLILNLTNSNILSHNQLPIQNENKSPIDSLLITLNGIFNEGILRAPIANLLIACYLKLKRYKMMGNLIEVVQEIGIFYKVKQDSDVNSNLNSQTFTNQMPQSSLKRNQTKNITNSFEKSKNPFDKKFEKWEKKPDKNWKKSNTLPERKQPNNFQNPETSPKKQEFTTKDQLIFSYFLCIHHFLHFNYKECHKISSILMDRVPEKMKILKNEIVIMGTLAQALCNRKMTTNNLRREIKTDDFLKPLLKNAYRFNISHFLPFLDGHIGLSFFHLSIVESLKFLVHNFASDNLQVALGEISQQQNQQNDPENKKSQLLALSKIKALFFIKGIKGDEWFFYLTKILEKGLVRGYISINKGVLVCSAVEIFPEV